MKKIKLITALSLLFLMIVSSCSRKKEEVGPDDYINAIQNDDYAEAQKVLDYLYADYLKKNYGNWPSQDKDEARNNYWSAAMYVYKAEMQYIMPMHDPEANERLIYTLQSINPVGERPIEGHIYEYGYGNAYLGSAEYNYLVFSNEFNKICLELIQIALNYDNLDIAEKVLKLIKPGLTCERLDEHEPDFEFSYNEEAKDEAKRLIDDYKGEE